MKNSLLSRAVVASSLVLALGGCDKLKSLAGGSAEAGAGAASGGLSLAGFEGEIDIAGTEKKAGQPDKTATVAMMVKGNKFRADMPTGIEGAEKIGKVYGIVDTDAKKAFIVLDQQKEVIEIDLNTVGQQVKSFQPPSGPKSAGTAEPPKNPPKITKTGKTDTVAGFSCEIWEIQSTEPGDKSKADVCVSQQGVSWFHFPMTGAPAEYAALGELVDGAHFPLRAVAFEKDGTTEGGRVEVTKVDKKTLDPSTFVPPPTYKVVDIATALQGFMSGAGFGGPGAAGEHGLPPGFPQGGHPPHAPTIHH